MPRQIGGALFFNGETRSFPYQYLSLSSLIFQASNGVFSFSDCYLMLFKMPMRRFCLKFHDRYKSHQIRHLPHPYVTHHNILHQGEPNK